MGVLLAQWNYRMAAEQIMGKLDNLHATEGHGVGRQQQCNNSVPEVLHLQ